MGVRPALAAAFGCWVCNGVLAFCQGHEIPYDRFRRVLRGLVLMRDEDRATALRILGPDALPTDTEILDYLREAEEDTGATLIARKPRRKFNPDVGEFAYERGNAQEPEYPPVAAAVGVQPSGMEKTHDDQGQTALLRDAAIALYFDDEPIDYSNIGVEVRRDGIGPYRHAIVEGWFGAGAFNIEARLRPDDKLFVLAGLLVVEVAQRDDTGRPTKVWAVRALPESVGFPPYEHTDWEYATSPATITYTPDPVATWDIEDIAKAAFAWAKDGGRSRMVGGMPPASFEID